VGRLPTCRFVVGCGLVGDVVVWVVVVVMAGGLLRAMLSLLNGC